MAIILLGLYLKKMKAWSQRDACKDMFTATWMDQQNVMVSRDQKEEGTRSCLMTKTVFILQLGAY